MEAAAGLQATEDSFSLCSIVRRGGPVDPKCHHLLWNNLQPLLEPLHSGRWFALSSFSASCSHGHRDQVRCREPERTGLREALELSGACIGQLGLPKRVQGEVRLSPTEL